MKRTPTWSVVLVATALVGCVGGEAPGSLGELGNGSFAYRCIDDGDAVCNTTDNVATSVELDLGIEGELPSAIAIGARFELDFYANAWEPQPLVSIVPARPSTVHTTGGFILQSEGYFAFLARNPEGSVSDFVHVQARGIDELDVWRDEQRITALSMTTNEAITVAVTASSTDALSMTLAGAVPYIWTSSDEAVVVIDAVDNTGTPQTGVEHNDDEVRLVALADGAATVTVSANDVSTTFTVDVEAGDPS